jgi:hypothetical protein
MIPRYYGKSEMRFRMDVPMRCLAFASLFWLLTSTSTAGASDETSKKKDPNNEEASARWELDTSVYNTSDEWNFSLGAGYAVSINYSATDTGFVQQSIRWGRVFIQSDTNRWYHGSWQFGVEVTPVFLVSQDETVYGFGAAPMIRRLFTAQGKFVPTLTIGAGVLGTTAAVPEDQARFNFTPQIGGGFFYFFRPRKALNLEYRFHHISNAGRVEPNPGINSNSIFVGLSLFR